MAELFYLDKKLDLDLALKAIEDGKKAYLDSKKIYKNFDENEWLDAYNKIMSSGITKVTLGTDNNGKYGYIVHHNGPVYEDPRGYYGDVAYYMLSTLSGLTPVKKEEPKSLQIFDAKQFRSDFGKHLAKKYYAGDSDFASSKWNDLDAPDKYGIRKTDNRKDRLIQALQTYKESLQDGIYSFEGSPFENLDDVRARIDNAIAKLNTPDPNDDEDALNALGWSKSDWLETGENKPVMVGDKLMTALEARNYLENAQKEKQKLKLLAIKDSQYKKYRFIDATKFNGTPPTGENVLGELNTYSSLGKLNGDLMSRLVGAFKFAEKNNALSPLSKEELQAFGSFLGADRLRKINGLNGFYWDSAGKRIVQPFMSVNDGTVLDFLGLVNLNDPKILQELNRQKADLRKLSEGFKTEDFLRMGAMALDITGAIAAWAPTYGTAISGGLGLTSLATNFIADWNDDSVTAGDMFKNAGINFALGAVGLVPGLGAAAKSGKWLANIAKWTPRILTLALAGHIALSDDIKNSLKKASSISDWNELTNHDVKNIVYALSTVAGLSRGAKGFINDRNFKPAFTENSEKQYTITTSKGKKVIKKELVDEIKKLNPKDKEKYNEELKKILKLEDDETFDTKNISVLGKELKNKGIEIKEENVPTGLSSKARAYREYLENKNNQSKENHKLLSKYVKTDYDIYKSNTLRSIPELSISDRIKNIWNPLSDRNLLKKGIKVKEEVPKSSTETSKPIETSKPKSVEISKQSKERIKKYNESVEKRIKGLDEGKFSKNKLKSGNLDIAGHKLLVVEQSDGTFNLIYKGNILGNFQKHEQKKLQEAIREIIKNRTVKIDPNTKIKSIGAKEIGKILLDLKARGWLKQGGKIDNSSVDDIINNYFKNKLI